MFCFQPLTSTKPLITNGHRTPSDLKPRSRSLENDTPEFRNNNARLELNLDSDPATQRARRASSIEEVEKKVPQPVKEEREDSFPSSHEASNVQQPIKKRPLRRESSWRQVSVLTLSSKL